ncbi:MAG: ABC transporter substrate-binding protein [Frankia sp.]
MRQPFEEDPQGAPGGYKIAEHAGVPVIGSYSYAEEYQNPTLYPIAAFFPTAQARVMFRVMKDEGVTKVAILAINVPVAAESAKRATAEASRLGLTVVSNARYAPTQTDFTAYVTKAIGAGAQAIQQIGGYTQGVAVAKALAQQGSNAKLIFASGYNASIASEIGSWGNGRVFSATPLLTLPERPGVVQALKQSGSSKVDASSNFVAVGWTDAEIATEGVRLLGSNAATAPNMINALNSISNFKGTYTASPLTYGSGVHASPSTCVQVQEMENGVLGVRKGTSPVCFAGSVAPTS